MNEPTYCKSCGAYIPTGQKKCLACGFPTEIPPLVDSEFESMRSHAGWKRYCDASKLQEKADIDLDKLLKQELFTVKIGGKVKWFYFGRSEMKIGSTIYHMKDLFGNISINHSEKQKFLMVMIER